MTVTSAEPGMPLLELERQRLDALTAREFDQLERLCHPDLLYTHSTGHTDNCRAYLDRCRSGFYRYDTIDCEVQARAVAGTTVAFTEVMSAHVRIDGRPRTLHTQALAVWAQTSEGWRFLAYHAAAWRLPPLGVVLAVL